jgi:hypothetical protein
MLGRAHVFSIVIAVDLFIERLGIQGLGRAGNPGDEQQRNKGGGNGLHGDVSCHFACCWTPTRTEAVGVL